MPSSLEKKLYNVVELKRINPKVLYEELNECLKIIAQLNSWELRFEGKKNEKARGFLRSLSS